LSAFLDELPNGWRNLIAATVGIAGGIAGYIPLGSLFLRALEHDFHWSKTASVASLMSLPVTAAVLPFAGRLVDKIGVRSVVSVSVLSAVAAYCWLSRLSNSKIEFYSAFLLLNVLGCATGPLAYSRLIVGDFERARGTALAIALAGIACATIALPPLVNEIIIVYTWRGGYLFFAALTLSAGTISFLLMRPQPLPAVTRVRNGGLGLAVRMRQFWLLGGAILLISAGTIGLVSQLQSVLIEAGLTTYTAAWLLSILGLSVGVSRLIIGRLLDFKSPTSAAATVMAIAAAGTLVILSGSNRREVLALGVSLIGVSAGAELDVMAYFCSRLFAIRNYGAIYGCLFSFHYVGMAVGALSYAAIYDLTGHYAIALVLTSVLLLLAGVMFLMLGRSINRPALHDSRVPA
jgi:predicted MFS family arabinose efflux permease